MNKICRAICRVGLLAGLAAFLCAAQTQAQQPAASTPMNSAAQAAHKIPVMDGGAGPCSLDLTVTAPDGKPVYAATVRVHVSYRFGGFHKLDLQASTNIDGKVRFVGLPSRVRRPPLEFQASKNQLVGVVDYDPASECQAKHDIMLAEPTPAK